MVEACERFSINKIIFTSSVAVYSTSSKPISEASETKPASMYGQSKLAAEDIYEGGLKRS